MMKWRKFKSVDELPRDTFLVYDHKVTSGIRIYEVLLMDDKTICCLASFDEFIPYKDFIWWRKMFKLPKE